MQRRKEITDTMPSASWPENDMVDFGERRRVADWPELERRMAIIARMTSDPPADSLEE